MFYYILEEYKTGIYKKHKFKTLKTLSLPAKIILFLLISSGLGFILFFILKMKMPSIISAAILIIDFSAIFFIKDKNDRKSNLEYMDIYKRNMIVNLVLLLKKQTVKMFSKNKIIWLINMCDARLIESATYDLSGSLKFFFIQIIYPIIAAVSAIIIKDMYQDEVINIAILVIIISVQCFAIFIMVFPVVKDFMNKDKKVIRSFREDLQYILVEYFT